MKLEKTLYIANKCSHTTIYTGICSHEKCNKVFYSFLKKTQYCKNGNTHITRLRRKCNNCSKRLNLPPYKVRKREMKGYKNIYCSRKCFTDHHTGKNNGNWKGGSIDGNGYRIIYISGKYALEHRHIMENILKRPLQKFEHVHHKDGNRSNNSQNNLELWVTPRQPYGQRLTDIISFVCNNYTSEVIAHLKSFNDRRA